MEEGGEEQVRGWRTKRLCPKTIRAVWHWNCTKAFALCIYEDRNNENIEDSSYVVAKTPELQFRLFCLRLRLMGALYCYYEVWICSCFGDLRNPCVTLHPGLRVHIHGGPCRRQEWRPCRKP